MVSIRVAIECGQREQFVAFSQEKKSDFPLDNLIFVVTLKLSHQKRRGKPMAFDLSTVTCGAVLRPPRIILLGVEKIGKSTFAASSDRPIFITVRGEEGIGDITVPKFPVCSQYSEVQSCISSLYNDKHDFGTVVIDSASALEPILHKKVCQGSRVDNIELAAGGYGKGYIEALDLWRDLLMGLDALWEHRNMAAIVIGHVNVRRFDDPCGPAYDQYHFDIQDGKNCSAVNTLFRWADSILFCNTKVAVKAESVGFKQEHKTGVDITNGSRFLYTQKRPSHPGGGRGPYGKIPYELPLNWNALVEAVTKASQ
jgi:hypothetical protein